MKKELRPLLWKDGKLVLLDQTRLPEKEIYITCADFRQVAEAICCLAVRGAPAIGVAAAFGLVLGAKEILAKRGDLRLELPAVFEELKSTRPTAVNLFWALDRMERVLEQKSVSAEGDLLLDLEIEALRMYEEDEECNRRIGEFGAELFTDGMRILTICNAGTLATVAHGTALSTIRMAVARQKGVSVVACETRPLLQGARLTTWELMRDGIPVTLITDGMAGYVMQKRLVDAVIVGADRVAANGDVANKIGTYTLAVLARKHRIPFYVAAPLSTVDLFTPDGEGIPIEERHADEVSLIKGVRIAPVGVKVFNPAFDLTPAGLITAIVTEKGVVRAGEFDRLAFLKMR